MGLKIYDEASPSSSFSTDGEFTNPITFAVDGVIGATILRRFYVRNDDAANYYTDIQVTPVVNGGVDIVTGATGGYRWKLIAGDTQPLDDEWETVAAGNTI